MIHISELRKFSQVMKKRGHREIVSDNESEAEQVTQQKRRKLDDSEQEEKKQPVKAASNKVTGKSETFITDKPKYKTNLPSLKNLKTTNLQPNLKHRVILWFRNDVRMHDNAVLHWAASQGNCAHKEFVPVYCFDPRSFDTAIPKFSIQRKTGVIRTKF